MSPSDNPPVLLLHGLATSANRTWRETGWIDLLQDEGRLVVAPDLPGHAVVDPPTDPDGYASFEADVWSHAPDEPFDAIGFSLGARTLLWLASEHPGRIRRLVVAGVGANLFRHDDTSDAEEIPIRIRITSLSWPDHLEPTHEPSSRWSTGRHRPSPSIGSARSTPRYSWCSATPISPGPPIHSWPHFPVRGS